MEINKKQTILIMIVLIIAQIAVRGYIGSKKEYFHMDEMYSYGLMNYDKLNIADNSDFFDNWHEKEYYQDYLEVNSNEVKNWKPVYENQKNDVHPPFYYLLLRIMATFTIDNFTKWTGIILNILIFCMSSIFVYLIGNRLFQNRIYALLLCFINGFTLVSLESAMYIRMYELTNLMVLILSYLHLRLWQNEEAGIKQILPLVVCWILGGLTHYYFFIYAVGMYVVTMYQMIRKKKYSVLWKYHLGILVAGISYLIIFPYAIGHIFGGYRGVGAGASIKNYGIQLLGYLQIINQNFFNGLLPILLFLLLIVTIFLWERRKTQTKEKKTAIMYFILPVILYLIVVVKNSPYIELRYIIPIYSIFTMLTVHGVKTVLSHFWDNKSAIFITVLFFLLILYSPVLTGTKVKQTYQQYNQIANKIENSNQPMLYIFNTNSNRFLDDLYLFTLADNSIIMKEEGLTEEKFKETINTAKEKQDEQEKGYILICNEGVDEKQVKSWITGETEYLQKMNACNIYKVN